MPFANFTKLEQEIIAYVQRDDLDLKVQTFIELAEHEMFNNPNAPLQITELELTSTAQTTITSRFIALPPLYTSMRSARLDILNESDFIQYRTPQKLQRIDDTGRPCFFTVIGPQIEFDRVPDEILTIEIQYYGKDNPLTQAAPTNFTLTNHPTIYLFGAVYQGMIFARDEEQAGKYKALFLEAIRGANLSDKLGRYGPAPVMQVEGSTP